MTQVRLGSLAVGLVLLVTGCASATSDTEGSSAGGAGADRPAPSAPSSRSTGFPYGPGPDDSPDPALSGQPVPTLPPGDPGLGEDGGAGDGEAGDGSHGEDGSGEVPTRALLDAATVGAIAGGAWSDAAPAAHPADPVGCTTEALPGARASRSGVLAAADGRLAQVVAGYRSIEAANTGVERTAERLRGCGFTSAGDPRLGTASAELTRPAGRGRPAQRATVVAAEGGAVLLVGSGSAAEAGAWESLVDLALGTSCEAAPHGCH